MELDPSQLGTLDLDEQWVPYFDDNSGGFLPTRVQVGADEYAFSSSVNIFGHGAILPQRIRDLRTAGKKPIIIERTGRYYVFVSPP